MNHIRLRAFRCLALKIQLVGKVPSHLSDNSARKKLLQSSRDPFRHPGQLMQTSFRLYPVL